VCSSDLAAGATPAFYSLVTSGYVDHVVVALFALGAVFLVRALRGGSDGDRILAVAACGANVAVKISAAPILVLVGLVVIVSAMRSGRRRLGIRLATIAAVALVGAVPYFRSWLDTGSPLYPVSFASLPHNEEFRLLHRGEMIPAEDRRTEAGELLGGLVWGSRADRWPHLNLGLSGPLLLLLGLVGAAALVRRRATAVSAIVLLLAAISNVALFLSNDFAAWRILWWPVSGRLLGVAVAALAILAAAAPWRFADAALGVALAFSLAQAFPVGFGSADVQGILASGAIVGSAVLVAVIVARRLHSFRAAAVAIILVTLAAAVPLHALRAALRYRIYAEAAGESGRLFDVHVIHRPYAAEWPLWRHLDTREKRRIAVTAGWDDMGHNWLRYPLYGSRLQNQVFYIPVTRDGSVIDYRNADAVARSADYETWLARLVAARADYVVVLPPLTTVEARWLREHPERFELAATGERGSGGAYRVRFATGGAHSP
jgi:hypothetical protein